MKSFRNFFIRSDFFVEAASDSMLDISIPNADKTFNGKLHLFFDTEFKIEEKTDGVKLTLFRNDEAYNPKDFSANWIVAYKNNVLHPNEFKKTNTKKVVKSGIGVTQYKLVFEHLKAIHKNLESVPKNTEFFIEFLMTKPTLTRSYDHKHGMILIGYSHNVTVETQTEFRLYTKDAKLNQKQNEHYAELLELDLPAQLFKGKVDTFENLLRGVENSNLKSAVNKHKTDLKDLYKRSDWDDLYQKIKEIFLSVTSFYGGTTEGVVLHDVNSGKIYKFLQADQHDKETRQKVKDKYKMSKEEEKKYYEKLKEIATDILNEIDLDRPFTQVIDEVSAAVQKVKFPQKLHAKKNDHQVREDLHLTTKMKYEKMLKGWAGVVGKFRIITKEHVKMIEYAVEKYKGATVMLVTGARDKKLAQVNMEILKEIFNGKPVEIISGSNGNIISLERKTRNPIVTYVCGPDREEDYKKQLENANNDSVVDVYDSGKRDSVSASLAEKMVRRGDMQQVKRIVHPVAYEHIDKWRNFYL